MYANGEMLAGYADPDADTDAYLCIRIMSLCCMPLRQCIL